MSCCRGVVFRCGRRVRRRGTIGISFVPIAGTSCLHYHPSFAVRVLWRGETVLMGALGGSHCVLSRPSICASALANVWNAAARQSSFSPSRSLGFSRSGSSYRPPVGRSSYGQESRPKSRASTRDVQRTQREEAQREMQREMAQMSLVSAEDELAATSIAVDDIARASGGKPQVDVKTPRKSVDRRKRKSKAKRRGQNQGKARMVGNKNAGKSFQYSTKFVGLAVPLSLLRNGASLATQESHIQCVSGHPRARRTESWECSRCLAPDPTRRHSRWCDQLRPTCRGASDLPHENRRCYSPTCSSRSVMKCRAQGPTFKQTQTVTRCEHC